MTIFKFLQKTEEEGTLLQFTMPGMPKTKKKRELQANIPDKYRCKNLKQNRSKELNRKLKGSYTMTKWDLFCDAKKFHPMKIN